MLPSSIRQYIPFPRGSGKCGNCKITLSPERSNGHRLCDVCWTMLDSVSTIHFRDAQAEWIRENERRVADKARMLNPNGGNDDPFDEPFDDGDEGKAS